MSWTAAYKNVVLIIVQRKKSFNAEKAIRWYDGRGLYDAIWKGVFVMANVAVYWRVRVHVENNVLIYLQRCPFLRGLRLLIYKQWDKTVDMSIEDSR